MRIPVRHADLPLNAEAKEFRPGSETPRDRSDHIPEEHSEEERGVEERMVTPAVESGDEQGDAETWRKRPKRA